MMRRRSLANTPISLRSLAWIAVAGLLGSAVLQSGHEVAPGILVVAGAAIMAALALGPIRAWFAPASSAESLDAEQVEARLEELEARVAETGQMEQRMAELEERLDFSERLLAQHNDAAQVPLHRNPI